MRAAHIGLLGLLTAASVALPSAQARPSADEVKRKLVGHWRLVKYETFTQTASGNPARGYDAGRIMYDEAGNMSAQLTRSGRPLITRDSTDRDRLAAAAGYVAYFGKYEIDAAKGIVTHRVEGSTNTSWVGTGLVRYYAFSSDGNRLMLSIKNNDRVTSMLTWEKLK